MTSPPTAAQVEEIRRRHALCLAEGEFEEPRHHTVGLQAHYDRATLLAALDARKQAVPDVATLRRIISESVLGHPYQDLYRHKPDAIADRYAKHDCNFPYQGDVDAAVEAIRSLLLGESKEGRD